MMRDELIGEVVTCMAKCGLSLAPWPPKSTPWRERLADAWRSLLADAALGLAVRKAHDEYVKHHRVYVFASEIHAALAAEQQPTREWREGDEWQHTDKGTFNVDIEASSAEQQPHECRKAQMEAGVSSAGTNVPDVGTKEAGDA